MEWLPSFSRMSSLTVPGTSTLSNFVLRGAYRRGLRDEELRAEELRSEELRGAEG